MARGIFPASHFLFGTQEATFCPLYIGKQKSDVFAREEVSIMTDEQKEQIKVLRQRGMGYIRVAQALGISENTIKSFCRRNKVTAQ